MHNQIYQDIYNCSTYQALCSKTFFWSVKNLLPNCGLFSSAAIFLQMIFLVPGDTVCLSLADAFVFIFGADSALKSFSWGVDGQIT